MKQESPKPLEKAERRKLDIIIYTAALAIIMALAFLVRILPLKWGGYLSEFDPYWHYYVAEHIVNNGVGWIFSDSWIDVRTWFPYGRAVASSTPMGLPLTAAAFYFLLKSLGFQFSLYNITLYFPPFMAALTSLTIYFLGKDVAGREAGLLAGLFLALNGAFLSRTTLGFFKHESVGIFAIVLTALLFLRAIDSKRPLKQNIIYSIIAGLAFAYLNISWGAFYYMLGLLPLFALIVIAAKKYTARLIPAYFITVGIGLALALPFPRPGSAVLTSILSLPALGGFALIALYEVTRHVKALKMGFLPIAISIIVVVAGAIVISQVGVFSPLAEKFITAIDPALRAITPAGPIVESVAEHRVSTWAVFYYSFGNLIFLAPVGLYFALKRGTNADIFAILFGLTAVYAAASLVRLNLIMAPAFCLLAAYGLVEVSKSVINAVKSSGIVARKKQVFPSINPKLGLVFLAVLVVIISPTFLSAVDSAYSPVTIANAGTPIKEFRSDWLDALDWIDHNVPKGTPVVAWWDYGYWIAIPGNSTSVCDNATLNTTQIARVGEVLLSNETVSSSLIKSYFKSDYVLIFLTTAPAGGGRHQPLGFGDEGKWVWIADIAHDVNPKISRETVDLNNDSFPDFNTLLGKTIFFSVGLATKEQYESWDVVYTSPSYEYMLKGLNQVTTQVIILKAKS